MSLTQAEKNILLDIARNAIQCRMDGKEPAESSMEYETLKEKRGAFVTIKEDEHLRGCIGCIDARESLYKAVKEMAIAAAFKDPRFPPLEHNELKHLTIEISALTPLKLIKDINEIEVGKHGIYIVKGYHSGILLPQVATEYAWDRFAFLEETCYKAGLSPNAWKEKDTKVYIFSAEVFSRHW